MPFVKGDVNINRGGRPEGSISVVSALKRELAKIPKDQTNKEKKTHMEMLIDAILEKGIKEKDVSMIKDIVDRVDGKAQQSIDHTTDGEKIETVVEFNYINPNDRDKTNTKATTKATPSVDKTTG